MTTAPHLPLVKSIPWSAYNNVLLSVAQDPESPEAHCELGFSYLDLLGYTDQAFAAFDRAISLKPDYAEAYRGLGWASIELNSFSKVIATGGRGIMNPSRLAKADEAFARAIALDPVDAQAHFGLAMAFTAQERYKEAIESALKALLLRPDKIGIGLPLRRGARLFDCFIVAALQEERGRGSPLPDSHVPRVALRNLCFNPLPGHCEGQAELARSDCLTILPPQIDRHDYLNLLCIHDALLT